LDPEANSKTGNLAFYRIACVVMQCVRGAWLTGGDEREGPWRGGKTGEFGGGESGGALGW